MVCPKYCDKLIRLLYLTEVESRYVAGNPENYFLKYLRRNLEFVKKFLGDTYDAQTFVRIIVRVSQDGRLPRRVTLFYVIAFALLNTDGARAHVIRSMIAKAFLIICETDEELFKFISIFTKLNTNTNKITTAVGNAINIYLNEKSYKQYAKEVGKAKGYHGWKYKDLIKLSHHKDSSIEKKMITSYVLFGLEKLKDLESARKKEIYDLLTKFERLRKTEDENEASVLITELHANFSQVNSKFIRSQQVWSSIIPELSVGEVLRLLPKLYKYDLLKPNSNVHTKVNEAITSEKRVEQCKLNPLEVFIYMKNFEKGGKPLHPKLEQYLKSKSESGDAKEKIENFRSEPKLSIIDSSLEKCLKLSYPKHFYKTMKKNIVLALDVSQDLELECFKNKNITCLEAQLFLTIYYSKMEKDVNVTLYQNNDIKEFNLYENVSFDQNLQKLKDNKSDYVVLPSVFQWAIKREQKVDVFICFIQSLRSLSSVPKEAETSGWDCLKNEFFNYKEHMSSPSTKLVVICPGSHNLAGFEDIEGALTIYGFCPEIPNVISAFVGNYSELKFF